MATLESAMQLYSALTPIVRNLNEEMMTTANIFQQIKVESNVCINIGQLQVVEQVINSTNIQLECMKDEISENESEQEKYTEAVQKSGSAVKDLKSMLSSAAQALGGMESVKKVMELSDRMAQTQTRLNMVVDDGGSVESLQQKIFHMAQRSRADYMDTCDVVAKLAQSTGGLWNSNDETIQFVENLNKQFLIAGASQQEMQSASAQLTQALASGTVSGTELNSIFAAAPNILQSIADYMGAPVDKIREMGAQGQISAQTLKNSLLSATQAIDTQFSSVPATWGQIWTSFQNEGVMAFQPILEQINALVNSEQFQLFVQNIFVVLQQVASYVIEAFGWIAQIGNSVIENWNTIGPIIYSVIAALIAYKAIVTAVKIAQLLLNMQIAVNPIMLVAIAIGVIIVTIARWVESVGGIAIAWLIMKNGVLSALDALKIGFFTAIFWIQDKWGQLALVFQRVGVTVANFVGDMKANVLILLQGMVNGAIDIINQFIEKLNATGVVSIDAIAQVTFGTNALLANEAEKQAREAQLKKAEAQLDSDSKGRQAELLKMQIEANLQRAVREAEIAAKRAEQAAKASEEKLQVAPTPGYVEETTGGSDSNYTAQPAEEVAANTSNTADNTAKIADSMESSTEELKWIREIAERQAINKFTTAHVTVDMTGMSNQISSDVDVDGFFNIFTTRLEESILISQERVSV